VEIDSEEKGYWEKEATPQARLWRKEQNLAEGV
jgi:hypothetical protein